MADQYSIAFDFVRAASPLSAGLQNALRRAFGSDHRLPPTILAMEGMSGRKYRMLLNNLIAGLPDARYLEIGVWKGSTVCSAAFGNSVAVTCVDNWSEYGGPREAFLTNVDRVRSADNAIRVIEEDFRRVAFGALGRFNVYFYDGHHSDADQYDGIVLALPALDDTFVLIVDDWNWRCVRDGVKRAIADLALDVESFVEIRTTQDDSHASVARAESDWHNGYFLAVVHKGGSRQASASIAA